MKIKIWRNISFIVLILGFSCVGHAQQEAQFSQYMFNKLSYNPGYAGTSGSICLTGLYRDQWMGLTFDAPTNAGANTAGVAPQNLLFSFDMPVKFLHGGLGATIYTDKAGYTSATNINVNYAYHLVWGTGILSIGFEGGLFNRALNSENLRGYDDMTGDPTNPTGSSSSDPLINQLAKDQNDMMTDFSFGLFYQTAGQFYAGLSMKNILAAKSDQLNYQNSRCIYLMAGYDYSIPTNPDIRLLPSTLIKTADFSLFQVDMSCLVEYNRTVWGGLSYRLQDAVAVLAGVNMEHMRIGMSYDFTTSVLGGIGKPGRSKGSMEIYLRYCFKIHIPPKMPTIYENTRYQW